MEHTPSTLVRIAMLNTDAPVPNIRATYPTYGAIFHRLLCGAAARISPHVRIESDDFDVVRGEYPAVPSDYNLLLISGSVSSSYDNDPWIAALDAYVLETYRRFPTVKIFGSCFGHQIICQSLLGESGVRVERDVENGWEIGVQEISLSQEFQTIFGSRLSPHVPRKPSVPQALKLQLVHHDQVLLPGGDMKSLPSSWLVVGSTDQCAVQGAYEPGRVLCFQGHFEFNRLINAETVKVFCSALEPAALEKAMEAVDQDDDSELVAEFVLRFLLDDVYQPQGLVDAAAPEKMELPHVLGTVTATACQA